MIEHDYTLTCDYGSHKLKFKPTAIPKKLKDVVFIEAPNSSGKSTLLNILALAFFGHKRTNLQESLKTKVQSLLDTEINQLTFSIKIDNKNCGELLEIVKTNPKTTDLEFKRTVKGDKTERLDQDRVIKEYELIYDIPVNPLDRLKELTNEIKARQQEIEKRVVSIRSKLHEYIVEIDANRDIKLLGDHRKDLKNIEKKAKDKEAERDRLIKLVEKLRIYTYTRLFLISLDFLKKTKEDLEKAEKAASKEKRESSKLGTKYTEIKEEIATIKQELSDLHKKSLSTLRRILVDKAEKGNIEVWADTDLDEELDESPKKIVTHARHFKSTLQDMVNSYEKSQESQIVNIFRDLLEVLEHYESSIVILPGLEKSVPEMIKIIEERFNIYSDKFHNINLARECNGQLERMIVSVNTITEDLKPELKALGKEITQTTGQIVDNAAEMKVTELNKKKEYYARLADTCKSELKGLNIPLNDVPRMFKAIIKEPIMEPFLKYEPESLTDVIYENQSQIDNLAKDAANLETKAKILQSEIKRISALKPHEYQPYKAILDDYHQVCIALAQKLRRCTSFLSELKGGDYEKIAADPEKMRYFDSVGVYLASVMKTIKHIDKTYNVKKIDMVGREVIASDGTEIRFDYFGTGQSQSAYLRGLLSRTDKKKLVVLFDEISNMDNDSLEPIRERIAELYSQGNLVMAMLVQKGDQTRVTSLVN